MALGRTRNASRCLFISVDSQRDTPETLESLSCSSFNPGITALTGTPAELKAAAAQFNAYYAKSGGADVDATYDHSVEIKLVGRDRSVFGTLNPGSDASERRAMLGMLLGE